jgi:hypothetical protein
MAVRTLPAPMSAVRCRSDVASTLLPYSFWPNIEIFSGNDSPLYKACRAISSSTIISALRRSDGLACHACVGCAMMP